MMLLKTLLTTGLVLASATTAFADRGGRYDGGHGYRGGSRTSIGLSFGFSDYGYRSGTSFGFGVSTGGYRGGYGGYYSGYRYAPSYCPPPYRERVIVERPVYVAPPTVVYQAPPPVYYAPPVNAGPPVYAAPPVYAPAPVYSPPPVYYYNGYGTGTYYYGR